MILAFNKTLPITYKKQKPIQRTIKKSLRLLRKIISRKRRTHKVSSLPIIRKNIQRRITQSTGHIKYKVPRLNRSTRSYHRQYGYRNQKRLFYRTHSPFLFQKLHYRRESLFFNRLRRDIYFYERSPFRRYQVRYSSSCPPLSQRHFSLGRIYITQRRRNTFITLNKVIKKKKIYI